MRDVFTQYVELVYGYKVSSASSVEIAKEMMRNDEFDVIVSDYQMPEEDGIQFLKELRKAKNDIPFILFTGKGREEIVISALNNGADYYMQKGGETQAQFAELMHFVKICAERRWSSEELLATKERLESFIEHTSDTIVMFDIDGHVTSFNSAFEKMYGWTKEEAYGRILPMVPDDETEAVSRRFVEVVKTGVSQHYIATRLKKDGQKFQASMTLSPVKNSRGRTIGLAGLARDITAEIEHRQEVEKQKEELRVILSSIGDAVVATDKDGTVTFMNHVASDLTGYLDSEARGKNVNEVMHLINEDSRQKVEVPVDTVIREGRVIGMANHTIIISRDGREHMIEDSAAPIRDTDGEIKGVVMVFKDATMQKLTERRRDARRRVSEVFANGTSTETTIPKILESIAVPLKLQRGEAWLIGDSGEELELKYEWDDRSAVSMAFADGSHKLTFKKGEGLPGKVWNTATPLWVESLDKESFFLRKELAIKVGLKSAFGVPVLNHGKMAGVLVFFGRSDLRVDNDMIVTVGDIGKQVSLFMARMEAEGRLRTLLQNLQSFVSDSPLIIISSDLEGNILFVNKSFEKAYGWNSDEVVGRNINMVVPESGRAQLREMIGKVIGGNPVTYESKRIRKDGSMITIRAMLSPTKDADGRVTQITSVCRDITNEKKTEMAVRLNSTVIENLREMVVVTEPNADGEPVVVYANPAYLSSGGYSRDEVEGKVLWELAGEAVDTAPLNEMYSSYHASLPYSGEIVKEDPSGVQHLETTFFPMKDSKGRITNWVQLQRDITGLVEQREGLEKANEKLNLMETISRHDMLNHLQAIELYTHMVLQSTDDNALTTRLDRIKSITEQMRKQLGALRDLQSSGNPRWMNLRSTFRKSVAGVDAGNAKIHCDGAEYEVMVDPLIDRVFYNLVDNSLRHGGSVENIWFMAREKGGSLCITYEDDGRGIASGSKKEIFAPGGPRQNHGLVLVKEILGITGITIRENGEEGKGARFEMEVPVTSYRSLKTGSDDEDTLRA